MRARHCFFGWQSRAQRRGVFFIPVTIKPLLHPGFAFYSSPMDTSASIIEKIRHYVGNGHYNAWNIGITTDPAAKKQELDNPPCWNSWEAGSRSDAKRVLDYFLKQFPAGPASNRIRRETTDTSNSTATAYIYIN
jgi:hypothetical protein